MTMTTTRMMTERGWSYRFRVYARYNMITCLDDVQGVFLMVVDLWMSVGLNGIGLRKRQYGELISQGFAIDTLAIAIVQHWHPAVSLHIAQHLKAQG